MRSEVPKTCNSSAEVTVSSGEAPSSGFACTQCMKVFLRLTIAEGKRGRMGLIFDESHLCVPSQLCKTSITTHIVGGNRLQKMTELMYQISPHKPTKSSNFLESSCN